MQIVKKEKQKYRITKMLGMVFLKGKSDYWKK